MWKPNNLNVFSFLHYTYSTCILALWILKSTFNLTFRSTFAMFNQADWKVLWYMTCLQSIRQMSHISQEACSQLKSSHACSTVKTTLLLIKLVKLAFFFLNKKIPEALLFVNTNLILSSWIQSILLKSLWILVFLPDDFIHAPSMFSNGHF